MALDGAQREVQSLGDLLVGEVVEEGQPHDRARRFTELIQLVEQDHTINHSVCFGFAG
ncbi:MAG: hypothetical protein V9E98_14505 [Candidatus Nanopelagicales bacterium]